MVYCLAYGTHLLKMMHICGNLSVAVLLFHYKRSSEDANAAPEDTNAAPEDP